ncbi:DUF1652 domain-containing protein [Pseudomonas sp. PB3P13]
MFLSALEIRSIVESGFLPKRCQCSLSPDLKMTVKVFADDKSEQVDLLVTGINASQLNSSRAISDLIAGLRSDLHQQANAQLLHPSKHAL